jgi:hypothetical protein
MVDKRGIELDARGFRERIPPPPEEVREEERSIELDDLSARFARDKSSALRQAFFADPSLVVSAAHREQLLYGLEEESVAQKRNYLQVCVDNFMDDQGLEGGAERISVMKEIYRVITAADDEVGVEAKEDAKIELLQQAIRELEVAQVKELLTRGVACQHFAEKVFIAMAELCSTCTVELSLELVRTSSGQVKEVGWPEYKAKMQRRSNEMLHMIRLLLRCGAPLKIKSGYSQYGQSLLVAALGRRGFFGILQPTGPLISYLIAKEEGFFEDVTNRGEKAFGLLFVQIIHKRLLHNDSAEDQEQFVREELLRRMEVLLDRIVALYELESPDQLLSSNRMGLAPELFDHGALFSEFRKTGGSLVRAQGFHSFFRWAKNKAREDPRQYPLDIKGIEMLEALFVSKGLKQQELTSDVYTELKRRDLGDAATATAGGAAAAADSAKESGTDSVSAASFGGEEKNTSEFVSVVGPKGVGRGPHQAGKQQTKNKSVKHKHG